MIGAGGLLHLLDAGIRIPDDIGLAGFNGVELLQGLPMQLATMDACRVEIGERAAQIVANRVLENEAKTDSIIELSPTLEVGDTLRNTQN
jgi:LacI family gluconate utilization system Gnt-I transcriptional repressor